MGCARVTGEWGGDEVRGYRGNRESRRSETRNRGGVVGRGESGKNAGVKKVRKRKHGGDQQMGRNIEGRLLRFAALS